MTYFQRNSKRTEWSFLDVAAILISKSLYQSSRILDRIFSNITIE